MWIPFSNKYWRGLSYSFEWRSQSYKKSASIKLRPQLFRRQKFYDSSPRIHLTPKDAKIALKSVLLNKINILSLVILWLPKFKSEEIVNCVHVSQNVQLAFGYREKLKFWSISWKVCILTITAKFEFEFSRKC